MYRAASLGARLRGTALQHLPRRTYAGRRPPASKPDAAVATRTSVYTTDAAGYQRFAPNEHTGFRKRLIPDQTLYYLLAGTGLLGTIYIFSHLERTPHTGRLRFMHCSRKTEQNLAAQSYQQILQQYARRIIHPQHRISQRIQRISQQIIRSSDMPSDLAWEVHVVDDPTMNAFVLPNGKIFVFTGLLNVAVSDEDLAVVLAHEMAHAVVRHGAEAISKQWWLLPIRFLLAQTKLSSSVNFMSLKLLIDLPHSRRQESEADDIGMLMMAKAGFDPRGAPHFWQRMARVKDHRGAAFLTTHPSDASRADAISANMSTYTTLYENRFYQAH